MDLKFTQEDAEFREKMRASLNAILPDDIRARVRAQTTMASHLPDQRRWFAILDEHGWAVPHWPVQHGGTGWSPLRRFIFEDEMHKADAPEFNWGGSHMVGPVIYTFGSQAQQEKFLKPTRSGTITWAQGFSEPGSGSDLASLRTNAKPQGDHYVVNGQKIWTSGAYEADWGFFLVKTDLTVKPQRGMSFFLIDMKSPGITIRQIPQINGEAHLCEVFLDNVVVPAENLVGEPGQGWTYGKFLLEHERTTSSFIFWSKRELRKAKHIAASETWGGTPLAQRPEFRARIALLESEMLALEWSVLRILANETYGYPPGVAASVVKIRGSELQQDITGLQADLLGARALRYYKPETLPYDKSPAWPDYVPGRSGIAMMIRAATIYGGSKQIQKNIIAKSAFGL
jgi:alkylation response protein AidB-like acyl-CoA dehydrogenase